MPRGICCNRSRRYLPVADALARIARGELLALGRGSGHAHFCCSCSAPCEALALVSCQRNGPPRSSLGYLALPELYLHARLVRNCMSGGGPHCRSVCVLAHSRVSEGSAHCVVVCSRMIGSDARKQVLAVGLAWFRSELRALYTRSVCVACVAFRGLACHPWPCMLLKLRLFVDSIPFRDSPDFNGLARLALRLRSV